jgi:hypothetical protein
MEPAPKPSYLFLKTIVRYLGNRTLNSNITFHTDHIRKTVSTWVEFLGHEQPLPIVKLIFYPFRLEHTKKKEISVRKFTLSKIGYSALKRVQANWTISSLVPGSCPPNWLHGKARISNPEVASN